MAFRDEIEMARDTSLKHRVANYASGLMSGEGTFSQRLVNISTDLLPLRAADFTEEIAPIFVQLNEIVEEQRTDTQSGYGNFKEPLPSDREKIAELTLDLFRLVMIAVEKHGHR